MHLVKNSNRPHFTRALHRRITEWPAGLSALALLSLMAVFVLTLFSADGVLADSWKGKEVKKENVLHIMNPATPMMESKTVELNELWRIGGDTDDEDEFFGVIGRIMTDDKGNVLLLDGQLAQVKIFSKNGEFIRDIGHEGEGPGEFRRPTGMFLTSDGNVGVLQIAPGKIVLLTPEGEPAGEYPLPTTEDGGYLMLLGGQSGNNNVVLALGKNAFSDGRFDTDRYLASVDLEGNEIARYHSETRSIDFAHPSLDETMWDTFDRRWTVGWDGRVYAATQYLGYKIHVWNIDGSLDRIIEVDHPRRKRTQEEKDLVESIYSLFLRQIPNSELKLNDYSKDIEAMYSREDGSLWVLSSEGSHDPPEGAIGIFDVFDSSGRYVHQVTLKGEGDPLTDGYYFVGDRLYVVTDLLQAALSLQAGGESFQIGDEEPDPMAVICYELDKNLSISQK